MTTIAKNTALMSPSRNNNSSSEDIYKEALSASDFMTEIKAIQNSNNPKIKGFRKAVSEYLSHLTNE